MSQSTSVAQAQMPCPTCKEMFSRKDSKAWPFCSSRCQMVDLGRWMKEDYRIPQGSNSEDLDGALSLQADGQAEPSDSLDSSEEL
jgi:hypothetical protein